MNIVGIDKGSDLDGLCRKVVGALFHGVPRGSALVASTHEVGFSCNGFLLFSLAVCVLYLLQLKTIRSLRSGIQHNQHTIE